MSELSPVYSEYERVSNLFRCLNEATLVARQAKLGLKTPSPEEEDDIRRDLETALDQLSYETAGKSRISFPGVLSQLEDGDMDISPVILSSIRRRVGSGLRALTDEDLEVIEKVTDVLDSTSELLFRRIQK
jgi:hypothetical protein